MRQYQNLLEKILRYGETESQRALVKGEMINTKVLYSERVEIPLREFPMVTCKKTSFKIVREELKWFLRGENNVKTLREKGVTIWDEWADINGDLGGSYPGTWRPFGGIHDSGGSGIVEGGVDQLARIERIMKVHAKNGPDDSYVRKQKRRIVLISYDPTIEDNKGPVGCHSLAQWHISPRGKIHCDLFMRSVDVFLGLPYNIASYGLLTGLLGEVGDLTVGNLVITMGNCHIYNNHDDAAWTAVRRPRHQLPELVMTFEGNPDDWSILDGGWDAKLEGYTSGESLKGDIAV